MQVMHVLATPQVAFTATPTLGCQPLIVTFTDQTLNGVFYAWDFGDGNTSAVPSPVHVYSTPGQFNPQLIVAMPFGCADTLGTQINVNPRPTAAFTATPPNQCGAPVTVSFQNNSTGAIGFDWDFGNGQTSTLNFPTTTYATVDTYYVSLIATNSFGCKDTAINPYYVFQIPTANFSFIPDSGCTPLTVQFIQGSQYAWTYTWDYGDGQTSNVPSPAHVYPNTGHYNVSLIAVGDGGCSDTLTWNNAIFAEPHPVASFTYHTFNMPAPDAEVQLTNTSLGAISYLWIFGDGDTSTLDNPYHSYSTNDTFVITLIATNQWGCSDTTTQIIPVEYVNGLYVPTALTPGYGVGADQIFTVKGIGIKDYHIWIFDTWGNKLWESTALDDQGSPTESWDGVYKSIPLPQDVYVWKIEATFTNGVVWAGKPDLNGRVRPTGTVTILR